MKPKKKIKPKIKVNKLNHNPLFIKVLNWEGDKYSIEDILHNLYDSFDTNDDKQIIMSKLKSLDDSFFDDIARFQKHFRFLLSDAISHKNVSEQFLLWLNNAFKYIEENKETYKNDINRKIIIKDPDGRWFQAIVCYNFIMTFNYFSFDIIKKCPICGNFFCHKGPYAKYCTSACKDKGMSKK